MQQGFENFELNIKLEEGGIMPTRANTSDAGLDVYSPETVYVYPGEDILIPLNWRCSMPEGYYLLMLNKSGRASKDKLLVGAQVIDSGYRGIAHCNLHNVGRNAITLRKGEKIAQMVVQQVWSGSPVEVEDLDMITDRGEGGFGSTGLK